MGAHWPDGGYSSDVTLTLDAGGRRLKLSHCGPRSVIVKHCTAEIAPCMGLLRVGVDDHESTYPVYIAGGIPEGKGVEVFYEKRELK